MIFGEDYSQLAASGEYEVYKSGTTLASLNEAIAGLSDEEYLDSFLVVNTDTSSANYIHKPMRNGNIRLYSALMISSNNDISFAQYWQNNVLYFRQKTISNGALSVVTKSTNGTGDTLLTITSWTLYRRQKSYDVSISGSKAASAIAPVQDSLATANRNYSVGQQFYYDGHLYKVTASITSGAQIVLGTNAELIDDITTQIRGAIRLINVSQTVNQSIAAHTGVRITLDFSAVVPSGYTMIGYSRIVLGTTNSLREALQATPLTIAPNTNASIVVVANITNSSVTLDTILAYMIVVRNELLGY